MQFRTPVGKRGGGLSEMHPADMGAHVLNALMDRTGVDPSAVEDVVFRMRRRAWTASRRYCADVRGFLPACLRRSLAQRLIVNVGPRSKRCILRRRALCLGRRSSSSLVAYKTCRRFQSVPRCLQPSSLVFTEGPLPWQQGLDRALRRPGSLPIPWSRNDCGEVGHL